MPNINEMLDRATPGLRELSSGTPGMFEDLYDVSAVILDDMIVLYNTGNRHREAGRKKWSKCEFIAQHDELKHSGGEDGLPLEYHAMMVIMLYSAYSDGFMGLKR